MPALPVLAARARTAPPSTDASEWAQDTMRLLQHTAGNQALQRLVAPEVARSGPPRTALSGVRAPASQGQYVQRQAERAPGVAGEATLTAINTWERALQGALNRYRNWLTHNLIMFLSDVLRSGRGRAAMAAVDVSFGRNVAEQALGNLGALTAVEIGARYGGRQLARLFLSQRTARVLGGVVGFVVGSIIEALIGSLLDRSNEVIRSTAERMDTLVTGVVNPIVNARQAEMTQAVQDLRDRLRKETMSDQDWQRLTYEVLKARTEVAQKFLKETDEYLYRQLALVADVYSGSSVPAEEGSPVKPGAVEQDLAFTMQHQVVKTGRTGILASSPRSDLVVRCRGYDCLRQQDGTFAPVDINGPHASPSWRMSPPPRSYAIQLYRSGTLVDREIGVPRTFNVGREQTAVWYNLPKGTYRIRVWRSSAHVVALAGEARYSVSTHE